MPRCPKSNPFKESNLKFGQKKVTAHMIWDLNKTSYIKLILSLKLTYKNWFSIEVIDLFHHNVDIQINSAQSKAVCEQLCNI